MSGPGIAVVGATGGCGTTTMTAALAVWGLAGTRRVLGVDGHGGGPHVLWGVPVARGVDHLDAVRDEVGPAHVAHIAHRGMGEWDLIAGPGNALAYAAWPEPLARRLATALVPASPWLADLGRGDHALAEGIISHASGVLVVTPRSLGGAEACRAMLDTLHDVRTVVGAVPRPGEDHLSSGALRRLLHGALIVEVPWDRRGVRSLVAGAGGRRGLAACARHVAEMVADHG
jgi:hypothetical protein